MDGVGELFGYNRESFMFDETLRQEREFQEQEMRVQQFLLYRDDVRDLTELTTSKMDSYLMIALLELGCCIELLVHGVIHFPEASLSGSQGEHPITWCLWVYVISLSEAFVFLFLSTWLAIHASITAHSFSVRLLTQFVRLPLPSKVQLDAATAKATRFEGMSAKEILRVPVLGQRAEPGETHGDDDDDDEATRASTPDPVSVAGLRHIQLYRDLQSNWQAHDAYARACLALGTYMLLHALAYYLIGLLVTELDAYESALGASILLPFLAWMIMRLDLIFGRAESFFGALFLMSGPIVSIIAIFLIQHPYSLPSWIRGLYHVLIPIVFGMHAALIIAIAVVAQGSQQSYRAAALPTRFRSVLYLDVFGSLSPTEALPEAPEPHTEAMSSRVAGVSMPGRLQQSLCVESHRLGMQLHHELKTWEAHDLQGLPRMAKRRQHMRRSFNSIRRDFQALLQAWGDEESAEELTSGLGLVEPDELWLQLEWQADELQPAATWFVRAGSAGEVCINEPSGDGIFVSSLDGLGSRVALLRQRVEMLKQSQSRRRTFAPRLDRLTRVIGGLLPAPNLRRSVASSASSPQHPMAMVTALSHRSAGAASSYIGAGGTNDASSALPESRGNTGRASCVSRRPGRSSSPVEERSNRATQETRFGGREAARLAELDVGGWTHSDSAARTFYPRRDGRPESKILPGRVPWLTFMMACVVLAGVWIVGLLQYSFDWHERRPGTRLSSGLPETLLFSDLPDGRLLLHPLSWPLRPAPVSAVALACAGRSSGRSTILLLAERFTVHELIVDIETLTLRRSETIERCLSQRPNFRMKGLVNISLRCDPAGRCQALLTAEGGASFRCHLVEQSPGTGEVALPLPVLPSSPSVLPKRRLRQAARLPSGRRCSFSCVSEAGLFALGFVESGELGPEIWQFGLPEPSISLNSTNVQLLSF